MLFKHKTMLTKQMLLIMEINAYGIIHSQFIYSEDWQTIVTVAQS